MIYRTSRLTQTGISHLILPLALFGIIAVAGVFSMVAGSASNTPPLENASAAASTKSCDQKALAVNGHIAELDKFMKYYLTSPSAEELRDYPLLVEDFSGKSVGIQSAKRYDAQRKEYVSYAMLNTRHQQALEAIRKADGKLNTTKYADASSKLNTTLLQARQNLTSSQAAFKAQYDKRSPFSCARNPKVVSSMYQLRSKQLAQFKRDLKSLKSANGSASKQYSLLAKQYQKRHKN